LVGIQKRQVTADTSTVLNIINLRSILIVSFLVMIQLTVHASDVLIIDGSTGVKPLVESLAKYYQRANPSTTIVLGTGLNPQERITALLDKEIHIAMASHGIDLKQIKEDGMVVHRIAKMAVVIGVNRSVSVGDISHSALCKIYARETTNWQTLGTANLAIKPFIRPYDEVDSEVVSAHIPCFAELQDIINIPVMKKSGQMAKVIAQTSGAIGMTTLVRVNQSQGKIRALSIEGIAPSTSNLASGAYSLTRNSYLITAFDPSLEVAAFLEYVRSEEGAQVIISNDAVPAF